LLFIVTYDIKKCERIEKQRYVVGTMLSNIIRNNQERRKEMKRNNLFEIVFIAVLLVVSVIVSAESGYAECLTVTSPNGGEIFIPASSKTISWTYDNTQQPGSYVKIELLKGGVLNAVLSNYTLIGSNGNGSYNWSVPSQQAGGQDYSIRVTSVTKPTCTDTSNSNFRIYTLRITSPNGGENWVQASKNIISWDSPGWPPGEKIRLELWQGANLIGTCFDNLSAGLVQWFTGSMGPVNQNTWAPPGSDYKIRIVSLTTNLSDMSDGTFTIAPPTIHLMSPNGGESWTFGTTRQVTWTSTGIRPLETVNLELLKGGNPVGSLSSVYSYEPQNAFNWKVGNAGGQFAPSGSDYKIRITTSMSHISDESDGVFAIAPVVLRLTSPNGGENWIQGSQKQITWVSEGCSDDSKITLRLLKGTTFKCEIANGILTSQGTYNWIAGKCANGSIVSVKDDYKIQIVSQGGCGPSSDPLPQDSSDGTFRLKLSYQVPGF
jgi:hypothetical protein